MQCSMVGRDALVAGHLAIFNGHVEILADQHTFTGQIQVSHFYYGHV